MTAFVFVLGSGRCGSTLVHEVLARHRDVAFLSNIDDRFGSVSTGRFNAAIFQHVPVNGTTKGRIRFAPSEGYRLLDRRVSHVLSRPARDLDAGDATPWLAGRFRGLFEECATTQRKPVLLHKFTGWPRARFVERALPGTRFIHVVRDGRAVVNSWLQMPWWMGLEGPARWQWGPLTEAQDDEWNRSGRSFAVLGGILWKELMESFEVARASVPSDQWLDVRYEDVVRDPRAAFREMLAFAGLEWDQRFERWLARYRLDTTRGEAYRNDLGPAVDDLEASIAVWLHRYGYDVPSPASLQESLRGASGQVQPEP